MIVRRVFIRVPQSPKVSREGEPRPEMMHLLPSNKLNHLNLFTKQDLCQAAAKRWSSATEVGDDEMAQTERKSRSNTVARAHHVIESEAGIC